VAGGHPHFDICLDTVSLMVTLDFAIPLGLLVNELITNCLKHSQPSGKTQILVRLCRPPDSSISLIVSAFRPAGAAAAGSGKAADDSANKTGMGMEIIRGLVAQLDGVIAIRDDDVYETEISIAAAYEL
jgi:two-component sensor histidine kinase